MPFIYQADVWCDECGKRICEQLAQAGKAPANPSDESSFDSDDYPKRYDADAAQADSPQNCASGSWPGCDFNTRHGRNSASDGVTATYGKFLENGLTEAGYKYLQAILNKHGATLPEFAQQWADFYQFTYFSNPYQSAHDWLTQTIQTHAAEIVDRDGGNTHAAALVSIANELASNLDSDEIQDSFQSDMDDDDFFKQTGWTSPEME